MNKYIGLTLVYAIGIIALLMSGLQTFNWLVVVAIVIGVLGLLYALYKTYMANNHE